MKNFSFVLGPHFSEVAYSKHPVGFVPLKNFLRIPRHLKGQLRVPSERLAANTSRRVRTIGTGGVGPRPHVSRPGERVALPAPCQRQTPRLRGISVREALTVGG